MREEIKGIVNFIGTATDEEVSLITNVMLYPELLNYIKNCKNWNGTQYPINSADAILQYILDRKLKKKLLFPEITILLNQLGFNMNSKSSYYFAWHLTEIIETNEEPLNKNWLESVKFEIESTQNQTIHTQLWNIIIGENAKTAEEIVGKILEFILKNKERFISTTKSSETRMRKKAENEEP